MKKTRSAVAAVMVGSLLLTAFAQEGAESKAPPTVSEILARAKTSYEAGHHAKCMSEIREASTVLMAERTRLIRAALPGAPAGLERLPMEELSVPELEKTSSAELMASSVGLLVTQKYKGKIQSILVTVMVDSPFLQKYQWNEAISEKTPGDSERIQYGKYKGLLADKGSGNLDLQLKVETSMVKVESVSLSRDDLLAFFDAKAVDVLAAALTK